MGEHSSYTGDLLSRVPTLRLYQARFVNDIPTPIPALPGNFDFADLNHKLTNNGLPGGNVVL